MATIKKRKSSTNLSQGSRKSVVKTGMKRKTRKRKKLGANMPVIGEIGIHNCLIGGTAGGVAAAFIKSNVPEIKLPEEMKGLTPYVKGLFLVGAALLAKNAKQPEVAAGLMGAAAVLTLQNLKVKGLSDAGMLSGKAAVNRQMDSAKYADINLLSAGNIYPQELLHDSEMLSQYSYAAND